MTNNAHRIETLTTLAARLEYQADLLRHGGAEARAGKLADEAFAIRWALRQVAVGDNT